MTAPARLGIPTGTLALLAALYFAQGLPYGFFTQALPVVLRESGFSLIAISATGVLFAPWALKFLWARTSTTTERGGSGCSRSSSRRRRCR